MKAKELARKIAAIALARLAAWLAPELVRDITSTRGAMRVLAFSGKEL